MSSARDKKKNVTCLVLEISKKERMSTIELVSEILFTRNKHIKGQFLVHDIFI